MLGDRQPLRPALHGGVAIGNPLIVDEASNIIPDRGHEFRLRLFEIEDVGIEGEVFRCGFHGRRGNTFGARRCLELGHAGLEIRMCRARRKKRNENHAGSGESHHAPHVTADVAVVQLGLERRKSPGARRGFRFVSERAEHVSDNVSAAADV